MNPETGLGAFAAEKYLSLETYRRNGRAVQTPVWFALAPTPAASGDAKIYVYTTADSGKAKRIRNSGAARIAPCDARGNVKGQWIDARAEIVGDDEAGLGMRLLNRKYIPWKQILDFLSLFARHERVVLVIRAASREASASTPTAPAASPASRSAH
ncbi:MAG: PPOX class F420-dependent oxidoreductase [Xanthobacteraceae bacterium]|jgi:PPOX class probable F420-dependent enzyme